MTDHPQNETNTQENENRYCSYMLRCSDNTIYSGYTTDPKAREQAHNEGKGAKYTRARLPVTLVYFETHESRSEAMKREYALKKLTRAQKEELIAAFTSKNDMLKGSDEDGEDRSLG